jgi:hypothetical protein
MRKCKRAKLRADLTSVRQDILIKLEELEERINSPDVGRIPEETTVATLPIEAIAQRMIDALGGEWTFTIERKGTGQTIQQAARALRIEEEKRLWSRKLYENNPK